MMTIEFGYPAIPLSGVAREMLSWAAWVAGLIEDADPAEGLEEIQGPQMSMERDG